MIIVSYSQGGDDENMLKAFLSSTYRDLPEERKEVLNKLNEALEGIGMEDFIPDGRKSHEIGIEKLKESDAVIFLISPWYGSYIENCTLEDCELNCHENGDESISYTHCEHKVALAEGKPHQAYLVGDEWNVLRKFEALNWTSINEDAVEADELFNSIPRKDLKQYFKVYTDCLRFRREAEGEYCRRVSNVDSISSHLADNIVNWYSEGKIDIEGLIGRRTDLKDLLEKLSENVEVHGVGGIGKTTLVHVALLIQKLKGKEIITLGTEQSYASGSGYAIFQDKCQHANKEILGNSITISDVINALSLSDELEMLETVEQIKKLSNYIQDYNISLFIDDFHLADDSVKEFVKKSRGIIIGSKRRTGIARREIHLTGIDEEEREVLIDHISNNFDKDLSQIAKEKIKIITEGHPVSTEFIVRNCDAINFERIEGFKTSDFSIPEHVTEFLERVIKDILSGDAYSLIKVLAVIDMGEENIFDKDSIENSQRIDNFTSVFNELIDTGMVKKADGIEGAYEFTYRHILDVIREGESHG